MWVTLEAHTAMAQLRLLQPEGAWMSQLEARDLPAQLEAITALAAMNPVPVMAVNALRACLLSATNCCRSVTPRPPP